MCKKYDNILNFKKETTYVKMLETVAHDKERIINLLENKLQDKKKCDQSVRSIR